MAILCHFKDLLWAEGVVPSEGISELAEYPPAPLDREETAAQSERGNA